MRYFLFAFLLCGCLVPSLAKSQALTVEQRIAAQIGQLIIQTQTQADQIDRLNSMITFQKKRIETLEKENPNAKQDPSPSQNNGSGGSQP